MNDKLHRVKDELRVVEFEANSRCNRRCDYCPVSILPKPDAPVFMPEDVLDRMIVELQRLEYSGRISYHFFNEPLIRRDLEQIIEKIRASLPESEQVLFTNGDFLTDDRYKSLTDSGVDFIVVTSHSGKQHPDRPKQHVQFLEELELTNRGGVLEHLPTVTPETLASSCFAPSEMLIVTATGDVVLCYEDASRRTNYGNILTDRIEDIWFDSDRLEVRRALELGDRSTAEAICKSCTNLAHTEPDKSDRSEPFWATLEV